MVWWWEEIHIPLAIQLTAAVVIVAVIAILMSQQTAMTEILAPLTHARQMGVFISLLTVTTEILALLTRALLTGVFMSL
jgi:hypothetical protein